MCATSGVSAVAGRVAAGPAVAERGARGGGRRHHGQALASHHRGAVLALQVLYGTLKAFHAAANHKASTPLCRAAVVAAVGELCWAHGGRVGSLGGDCVGVCARQLGLRDLGLRRAAMDALAAVLTGGVPLWVFDQDDRFRCSRFGPPSLSS